MEFSFFREQVHTRTNQRKAFLRLGTETVLCLPGFVGRSPDTGACAGKVYYNDPQYHVTVIHTCDGLAYVAAEYVLSVYQAGECVVILHLAAWMLHPIPSQTAKHK